MHEEAMSIPMSSWIPTSGQWYNDGLQKEYRLDYYNVPWLFKTVQRVMDDKRPHSKEFPGRASHNTDSEGAIVWPSNQFLFRRTVYRYMWVLLYGLSTNFSWGEQNVPCPKFHIFFENGNWNLMVIIDYNIMACLMYLEAIQLHLYY